MVTLDNLVGRVFRIKDKYHLDLSLKIKRGKFYIVLTEGSEGKPISPTLNAKNMDEWLDALEVGLEIKK